MFVYLNEFYFERFVIICLGATEGEEWRELVTASAAESSWIMHTCLTLHEGQTDSAVFLTDIVA